MKPFIALATVLITAAPLAAATTSQQTTLEQQAKSLVQQFAGKLKPRLIKGIQEGGPAHAIGVCAEQAPAIAEELSKASGWQIKRVSLKPRRQPAAIADQWETQVLQQFETELKQGKPASQLVYSEVIGKEFRFMKAQIAEPLCLNCHGKTLMPAVTQALQEAYPSDTATGYAGGEVRGAFSLRKSVTSP